MSLSGDNFLLSLSELRNSGVSVFFSGRNFSILLLLEFFHSLVSLGNSGDGILEILLGFCELSFGVHPDLGLILLDLFSRSEIDNRLVESNSVDLFDLVR